MKLRVLIADDEALSRERLRKFLLEDPRTEIVAECQTGAETLEQIRQTSPQLVFMDIQMPEMDGLAVVERFKGADLPVIVFVTAFERFALRAFDVHAVDYLLKPFDRSRFQTAFSRALERLKSLGGSVSRSTADDNSARLGRLAIKSHGRISLINPIEIDWISTADNYMVLHIAKASHFLRSTLKNLVAQLPKDGFVRISRSHLVNLERVKEIQSKSHGDAVVILHDGTELPASRIYLREMRRLIKTFR